MGNVIVVTSGKGGVGKTTSTASIGAALAEGGKRVCVVDFDVGLRNLDLVLGAERRVVYDFINVAQGDAKLAQALIRDKRVETLYLLAASQTRDKDALTDDGVERVIGELKDNFDYVICDSPAGIERGALLAMRFADKAVVVANPEVSSVRDSDRIIGLLDSRTRRAEGGQRIEKYLLLTRYDPLRSARGEMLSVADVLEILSVPLLGIIPESEDILRASNVGSPITMSAGAERRRPRPTRTPRGASPASRCRWRCRPTRSPSSAAYSAGGRRMNLLKVFQARAHRAGGARTPADPARARARPPRPRGSDLEAARRPHRDDPAPCRDRPRQGDGQDGRRRLGLDAGDRHRDPAREDRRRRPAQVERSRDGGLNGAAAARPPPLTSPIASRSARARGTAGRRDGRARFATRPADFFRRRRFAPGA